MSVIYKFLFPSKTGQHSHVITIIGITHFIRYIINVSRSTKMGKLRCHE